MNEYDEIEKIHNSIREKLEYINETLVPTMDAEALELHEKICECFDILVMLKEKSESAQ